MTQRTLKLHGSLTIACLGFVASMAACLGDDSTEPPTHDAAAADHAVTTDSPTTPPDNSSPRADSAPDTSMTPDAGRDVSVGDSSPTPDGGGRDSTPEATTADARDSAPEAARETGPDSNPPIEAGPGDARVDQVAEAAPPEAAPPEAAAPEAAPEAGDTALHMCGVFDEAFAVAQPDAGQCVDATPPDCPIDRAFTWSLAFVMAYGGGDINNDCRINGMFATLTPSDLNDYGNYLIAWNLAFFGCPDVTATPPPLTYGLIPAPLASQPFTTADLRLISQYYVAGVQQALSDAALPPLSQTQLNQIDAQLAALEQAVPTRVPANTYSYTTCAPDAGSD